MTSRLLLAVLLVPTAAFADDSLKEPAQKLVLKIGGKAVPMVVGTEAKLEGEFKDPAVTIEAASARSFDAAGIKFDYPAGYNWEATRDKNGHTWTMEGPDVTLIVFRYAAVVVDAGQVADGLAARIGKTAVKTELTETHGGREFKGWKIQGKLSGVPMTFHVFTVPLKEGSLMFEVIDKPGRAKKDSAEFKTTMELLGKTLSTAGG